MATKKAGGSSKNGRDSIGKRLGLKVGDGQKVNHGAIIVRQRGATYKCGINTFFGKDYTLHAGTNGVIRFYKVKKNVTYVAVDAA